MVFSVNSLALSAAILRIASRAAGSATEPQPQPAAVTEMQRSRVADADMQRGIGAHGMADHMCLLDAERVHDRDNVGARDVLAIARRIARHVGRRIAARAKK